jgi:hypothetical protein
VTKANKNGKLLVVTETLVQRGAGWLPNSCVLCVYQLVLTQPVARKQFKEIDAWVTQQNPWVTQWKTLGHAV